MVILSLLLGCSSAPNEGPDAAGGALDAAAAAVDAATPAPDVGAPLPDAGPMIPDTGVEPPDAAMPPDAEPTCAPLAPYKGDAGGPNTPPTAGKCTRDSDCPQGQFCYAPSLTCVDPMAVGYSSGNGQGGTRYDGTACWHTFSWPSTCSPEALRWTDSVNLSRSAKSFVESDTVLTADGKGTVLAAWAATAPKGYPSQVNQLALSRDDGASFTLLPTPTNAASDAANDPVLAFDSKAGWLYLWEAYAKDFHGAQHVWLSTAPDAETWTAPVQVDTPGDYVIGGIIDFPWMSLDSANQRLYVTYQAIASTTAPVFTERLVVGAPDGKSFAPSIELDDGTRPTQERNLARHVVDAAGSLYAVWLEGDGGEMIGGTIGGVVTTAAYFRRFDRSGADLVPMAADVRISSPQEMVTFDTFALAVKPDGSVLHALYVVGDKNAVDVVVATSLDRGATWGKSVRVNDETNCATHFHPGFALDASGRLWVVWYDNRDGFGHLVYSVSEDGGQSFRPNRLVSAPVFGFDTFQYSAGWLGDYFEPAITATEIYLLWSDGREGGQSHAFFAKATLP
jgi:hypothetical protein